MDAVKPKLATKTDCRAEVTIFEMLALVILIGVPIFAGKLVTQKFGLKSGIASGILSGIPCLTAVILFYRISGRRYEQRKHELREKYQNVYRVISLPTGETNIKKSPGAEIRIGDYGWQAEPPRDDGLIYLQGLTSKWRVVWYGGFRSDQIEKVAPKPLSQYDWNYSWMQSPPECPYPVQERPTTNMGLPNVYGWNGPKRK